MLRRAKAGQQLTNVRILQRVKKQEISLTRNTYGCMLLIVKKRWRYENSILFFKEGGCIELPIFLQLLGSGKIFSHT